MQKMILVLCGLVLVGCAKSQRPETSGAGIEPSVLTRALAMAQMEQGGESNFRCVLDKVKAGPVAGSFALFPGQGVKTTGLLLHQFDSAEYETKYSDLKAGQSIWLVVSGQCKPYSAPYPINPLHDPLGVFTSYTIRSSAVDATPQWTADPLKIPSK